MKIMNGQKGVSIIGTVFTLIVLGILGAALVALVATDQETRMKSLKREYAFYAVQAGFEWALREIKEGGYPLAQAKVLPESTFTVSIDPSPRKITVLGASNNVQRTYSITTNLLAKDCMTVDLSGATIGGMSNNEIHDITITHTTPNCLNAVSIDKMTFTWLPNITEKVRRIRIGGVDVYTDATGTASGAATDIQDVKITNSATIEVVEFSSSMSGKNVTLKATSTDSSELTSAARSF